jgi:V/A-type H+-transporting ATPase subunit D
MRDEMHLVVQGRGILEEQRDLLAHRIMDLLRLGDAMVEQFALDFAAARDALRRAVLRHGAGGLDAYARTTTSWPAPRWEARNVFGCLVVEDPGESETAAAPQLDDGWSASLELEIALLRFHQLLGLAARMAALQNNLGRLTRTFVRTQRRVNALENIILPELQQSIRETENVLDEMERESLVRAHVIKKPH